MLGPSIAVMILTLLVVAARIESRRPEWRAWRVQEAIRLARARGEANPFDCSGYVYGGRWQFPLITVDQARRVAEHALASGMFADDVTIEFCNEANAETFSMVTRAPKMLWSVIRVDARDRVGHPTGSTRYPR